MTQQPHDKFAKQFLKELLSPFGEVKTNREITDETRFVDVLFSPTPTSAVDVRISVMTQTELTKDDQELIMNLTQAYEEARAQAVQEGVQQGVQQGQRQVVENLLRFRFGSVDEELSRVVESLLQLTPDDFARVLLELSTLSREELLARFNSHE